MDLRHDFLSYFEKCPTSGKILGKKDIVSFVEVENSQSVIQNYQPILLPIHIKCFQLSNGRRNGEGVEISFKKSLPIKKDCINAS